MKAVALIGHHNSGKTGLIRELIPALRGRGVRVGTVKHVAPEVEIDTPGKDSYLHRRAGAERVLVLSDAGGALLWEHGHRPVEQDIDAHLQRHLGDLDLVLAEGFKHSDLPKLEVYRSGEPLAGRIEVLAVITEGNPRVPDGVPLLPPDVEEIADFLEASVLEA